MFSMLNFAKFTNLDFGQILGKVPPSKACPSSTLHAWADQRPLKTRPGSRDGARAFDPTDDVARAAAHGAMAVPVVVGHHAAATVQLVEQALKLIGNINLPR